MTGNLAAPLDYTTAPHFGYNTARAIGDTVWNDINGVGGLQDATEPGIAGVTVLLYRDVDDDGEYEPGDDDGGADGSSVTASPGLYLFAGPSEWAQWWVSIATPQAALSGFNSLTTETIRRPPRLAINGGYADA